MALLKTRPTVALSISAGLALLILLVLCGWQVERLFWKENLIAEREAQASLPPIDLGADTSACQGDSILLSWHRTSIFWCNWLCCNVLHKGA